MHALQYSCTLAVSDEKGQQQGRKKYTEKYKRQSNKKHVGNK